MNERTYDQQSRNLAPVTNDNVVLGGQQVQAWTPEHAERMLGRQHLNRGANASARAVVAEAQASKIEQHEGIVAQNYLSTQPQQRVREVAFEANLKQEGSAVNRAATYIAIEKMPAAERDSAILKENLKAIDREKQLVKNDPFGARGAEFKANMEVRSFRAFAKEAIASGDEDGALRALHTREVRPAVEEVARASVSDKDAMRSITYEQPGISYKDMRKELNTNSQPAAANPRPFG
jgi:hypothetical protein